VAVNLGLGLFPGARYILSGC